MNPPSNSEILFTRQRHEADKAGLHWDYRLVHDDKAYSWATKKELPTPGKSIILFEQPVHDREYALSKKVIIPKGEYGAGITTLDWVRKAYLKGYDDEKDKFVIEVKNGERYLLKKLDSNKYGEKAWLFRNLSNMEKNSKLNLGDKSLREHQESAVAATLKRDGNILFSHPVGSGKTLTSISAFEALKNEGKANRVLVVTPASLRTNYGENGVKRFTDSNYSIYGNKQEISSDKSGIFKEPTSEGPEYGIVSYELFREDPKKYIEGHKADTVIFDELHRIKNDESKTFKALKEHRNLFRNFIGMTGSISSNSPSDVVPLIDAMTNGDHKLGTKQSFENRFVSIDNKGNKTIGNKILAKILLGPYVHNVTEDQVNNNSSVKPPKKEINEIEVLLNDEHADYYRYAINQLDPLTKLKLQYQLGKMSKAQLEGLFSKLLKSRQVANSLATINKDMSLEESANKSSKVIKLLDDVESHLNTTPDAQVIIHSELLKGGIDVLEAGLNQRGIQYRKFIGKGNSGITEKSRQEAINDYNSGKKKVILISSAGSEGLDLPNTTMVASLDGHWNPERINQTEARGVRMGGLSNRPEEERKVIINRYISKLPLSKVEVAKGIFENISPGVILDRVLSGGPAFFNPFSRLSTVDQLMYQIAKQKEVGNKQLKDLFHKTAAYSLNSDKDILEAYLNKFQDHLASGDYEGKYIDPAEENVYIERLRNYYDLAKSNKAININLKDYQKQKEEGPLLYKTKNVLKGMGSGALLAAPLLNPIIAEPMGQILTKVIMRHPYPLKFVAPTFNKGNILRLAMGAGIIGGLGYLGYRSGNQPQVTTTKALAKRMGKLTDEELLEVLRGNVVSKEIIKKEDNFIRMK
jgi:superfamily II DNA or RNA helicase